MDKNDITGYQEAFPDLPGKYRQEIGHRFDAQLLMRHDGKNFLAHTKPWKEYKCKARNYSGPDIIIDPSFDKLYGGKS